MTLRFTAVVNFNSKLRQHVPIINILTVTSQWEGKGEARGRWRRKTEVHKNCVWGREQVSERETKRLFVCLWERKEEREKPWWWSTPGCHHSAAVSGCNKKHRITSPTPCFAFFPSPCVSSTRWGFRLQLCRGYAETEPTSKEGSLDAINKLRLGDHSRQRQALDLQLIVTALEVKRKVKEEKKKRRGSC